MKVSTLHHGMLAGFFVVFIFCGIALADAPLPLHTIQGNSGVHLTPTAYLANPPAEGEIFGKPSVSFTFTKLGQKDLESFAVTQNLWGRFELGYAIQRLGLGDWPDDVRDYTGLHIRNHVKLHNFNIRYMAVEEGAFDCELMPAITVGAHFKWNENTNDLDRQLGGLIDALGADHDNGTDITVMASKTVKGLLPNPMILSCGLRNTDAIHTGLVGFAGERRTVFEGSVIYFLTERLAFAAEYKQKPNLMDDLTAGGGHLVKTENDWWDLCLAYVVNDNMTISGGYANFGNVLGEQAKDGWSLQLKYEF
jgi:hypothetical protein